MNKFLLSIVVFFTFIFFALITAYKNIGNWVLLVLVGFIQYRLCLVVRSFLLGREMGFSGAFLPANASMSYRMLLLFNILIIFFFLMFVSFSR